MSNITEIDTIPFEHKLAAHCESGVVTRLLSNAGIEMTESMVFGIAGAILFVYFNSPMLPFPTIAVRNQPGKILSKLTKHLGINLRTSRYKDHEEARNRLDEMLKKGIPVGVQVDFFYMDYIPSYARAHFNGHYIVIIGKKNNRYIVSDAYAPILVEIDPESLDKARFAKGPFAPKGHMFYMEKNSNQHNLEKAIIRGIRHAAFYMLRVPLPFVGARGIRFFSKKIVDWPKYARDTDHLSHEIMMLNVLLEERGTGGGGFRYLYATFLREAGKILNKPALEDTAKKMMENGDAWRMISFFAAKIGKNRDLGKDKLTELGEMIRARSAVERDLFMEILRIVKS